MSNEPEVWRCICGEEFSVKVWHCPVCLHHWPLERPECNNCYKGKPLRGLIAKRIPYRGSETELIRLEGTARRAAKQKKPSPELALPPGYEIYIPHREDEGI